MPWPSRFQHRKGCTVIIQSFNSGTGDFFSGGFFSGGAIPTATTCPSNLPGIKSELGQPNSCAYIIWHREVNFACGLIDGEAGHRCLLSVFLRGEDGSTPFFSFGLIPARR
jgi:hypothetical protein